MVIKCAYCGKQVKAVRRTKKVCSLRCQTRLRLNLPRNRKCALCSNVFEILVRGDNNRRYCSSACSKKATSKKTLAWHQSHPEAMSLYNKNRLVKNPGAWREKHRNERIEVIRLLGGKCIACKVTNPNWLHVDFIPTTKGKPYRHPRHLKYIREHMSDFRLLCANHHYELTLTGKIVGMRITQAARRS